MAISYLVEAVQKNRVVKVIIRTPDYDRALAQFQRVKALPYRETRMFKSDEEKGKVLLKFLVRDPVRQARRT